MRIRDVMTTDVLTVTPETSLKEAAEILAERRISGLPVVDSEGSVLGVLSEADILFKERLRPEERGLLLRLFRGGDARLREKPEATTVGEAMTAPAMTIDGGYPVSLAAERMLEARIHRLPVVDHHGKLVGIVTRADLVRAFVRSDAEIERELHDDVLLGLRRPEEIAVTVEKGVVHLSGTVDSRLDAEGIPSLARLVPGVVKVEGKLDWRFDPRTERASAYAPWGTPL
jgi:CBS domain-containing protein